MSKEELKDALIKVLNEVENLVSGNRGNYYGVLVVVVGGGGGRGRAVRG